MNTCTAALIAIVGVCAQPDLPLARTQAYCADMAKISINEELEKLLPGSRAEFSSSCVAAAIRTAQFRAGQ